MLDIVLALHGRLDVVIQSACAIMQNVDAGTSPAMTCTVAPTTGQDDARTQEKTPGSFLPGVLLDSCQTIGIRSYAEREC
jgi:hypothetical protein